MSNKIATPYKGTPIVSNHLDILKMPIIKKSLDDEEIVLDKKYEYRPDKLALDLYGNENLWFVFILRNMDKIKDPIFDFKAGMKLFVPSKNNAGSIHYGS